MKRTTHPILLAIALLFGALSPTHAQFLDFSQPARAAALGGDLVAMPEGPSAMVFNPAGLAPVDRIESSARFESLFPGLENDSISTGNITLLVPTGKWGGLGGSWDHLGSDTLSQDRFRAGWGNKFSNTGLLSDISFGLSFSYVSQRFSLNTPLTGVSLTQLSSSSYGLGGGILMSLPLNLALGLSADDVNQPNLGVVGADRLPATYRWGLAEKLIDRGPFQLTATAAQSLSDSDLETQGGLECFFQPYGVRLRAGVGTYQGAVGLGFEESDLFFDYAYLFSVSPSSQIAGVGLPGSHLLEIGAKWGDPPAITAYNDYIKKAKEAEGLNRWDKAFWYYQTALTMRPNDLTATDGKKRALVQYNLQRADHFYQDGLAAEKNVYLMESKNDYEMALQLNAANADYSKALDRVKAAMAAQKVAALVTPSPTPTPNTEEVDTTNTLQQVAALLSADKREAAAKILAAALARHPHQATLEMVLKSLTPEVHTVEKPVSNKSDQDVQLLITEADIYMSKGRPDMAKKNLEEVLKAQPENAEAKHKLAHIEAPTEGVSQAKMQMAQELYEKGLKMYLDGDLDGAIKAWEEALKDDPNQTKAQNNLIRAKLEKESEKP